MPKKTQQIGLSIFQSLPPSNSYVQISKDQFMITISGLNPWQLTHGAGKATYQVWSSPSLVTNTNPLSLISLPGWWVASARLFFFNLFYSSIVGLQCCINFCCTEKWLGYTHIPILFHILFHYGLSQDIENGSLSYTVGPCWLSILYMLVCIC